MIVYLDRNVFHHIRCRPQHGVKEADYKLLKRAVTSGKVRIAPSITLLEETLPVLRTTSDVGRLDNQLIAELTDRSKFIKPWNELLQDDIRCYASGKPLESPFTREFDHLAIENYLTPSKAELPELLTVVQEAQAGKEEIQADLRAWKQPACDGFRSIPKGRTLSFEDYKDRCVMEQAEALAERHKVLSECRERGFEGFLKVRSVEALLGAYISLSFALARENYRVDAGYWHDLQNVVLASSTDAFVTHDTRFSKIVRRGVESLVVMDLPELLERLK